MRFRFSLPLHTPMGPHIMVLFVATFLGMAFIAWSRNVPLKHIALPIVLTTFSSTAYLIVTGDSQHSPDRFTRLLIILGLFANAVWAYISTRYCPECGITISNSVPGSPLCPECCAKVPGRQPSGVPRANPPG